MDVPWLRLLVLTLLQTLVISHDKQSSSRVLQSQLVPHSAVVYSPRASRSHHWGHLEPANQDLDEPSLYQNPEKFHVVSSALRILPKKSSPERPTRKRRDTDHQPGQQWRVPRQHQFVTSGSSGGSTRTGRQLDQDPVRYIHRYFEPDRYNDDYYSRRNSFNNKRVIYYATLPEIVRGPNDWNRPPYNGPPYNGPPAPYTNNYNPHYPPPYNPPSYAPPSPPSYPGYPPIRDNEIVTRVQSNIIDITGNTNKDRNKNPNALNLSSQKITIIDAEPPYYQQQQRPNHFDQFNRFDQFYKPPFGYYDDYRRPPYRDPLPPQPEVTILKRPLDVRPLDPIRDVTTTRSPNDRTTTTQRPSTTLNPIQAFERTYKY